MASISLSLWALLSPYEAVLNAAQFPPAIPVWHSPGAFINIQTDFVFPPVLYKVYGLKTIFFVIFTVYPKRFYLWHVCATNAVNQFPDFFGEQGTGSL